MVGQSTDRRSATSSVQVIRLRGRRRGKGRTQLAVPCSTHKCLAFMPSAYPAYLCLRCSCSPESALRRSLSKKFRSRRTSRSPLASPSTLPLSQAPRRPVQTDFPLVSFAISAWQNRQVGGANLDAAGANGIRMSQCGLAGLSFLPHPGLLSIVKRCRHAQRGRTPSHAVPRLLSPHCSPAPTHRALASCSRIATCVHR